MSCAIDCRAQRRRSHHEPYPCRHTRPQLALQSYLDSLLQEAAIELANSVSLEEFEAAVLEEQVRDARLNQARPVLAAAPEAASACGTCRIP